MVYRVSLTVTTREEGTFGGQCLDAVRKIEDHRIATFGLDFFVESVLQPHPYSEDKVATDLCASYTRG